jgi:hypothetical protein
LIDKSLLKKSNATTVRAYTHLPTGSMLNAVLPKGPVANIFHTLECLKCSPIKG